MKRHVVLVMIGSLFAAPIVQAGFESPDPQSVSPEPDLGRAWQLTARAFFGYNDNVQVVPDTTFFTGDESDAFAGVSVSGTYRIHQGEFLSLFAVGEISQLLYLGNPAGGGGTTDDYDLTVLSPGLLAIVPHSVGGYEASASLRYSFRHEAGRDVAAIGLSSHSIALTESIAINQQTSVTAGLSFGIDNYEVDFPTPATDDRDADRFGLTLGIKHRWDNNRRNASFQYAFTDHDAEGSNFDYDAHAFTGRFETHLLGPLWGAAELGYSLGDYNGFTSGFIPAPGRTEQDNLNFALQFIYVIDAKWSVDFSYRFTSYESNQPQFESEVNQFAIGLTYKF